MAVNAKTRQRDGVDVIKLTDRHSLVREYRTGFNHSGQEEYLVESYCLPKATEQGFTQGLGNRRYHNLVEGACMRRRNFGGRQFPSCNSDKTQAAALQKEELSARCGFVYMRGRYSAR